MTKRVFVSGCYDMLHSGHVAFFKEAASYGELYVGIGSDQTVWELKGRHTINSEHERLYMVQSVRYVTDAWVNSGSGLLDFEADVRRFMPDLFIVNEDGHTPMKEKLCTELGINYLILKRLPEAGLPARSTTSIRSMNTCQLPFRLDLAGTWIDQPYVSKYGAGWALTVSLEPTIDFMERCGMSTSTRNAARKLWPHQLPLEHPEKLAEMLFRYENEPGRIEISGAQDAIGICMPGLNRHYYNGGYWPERIESIHDESILNWLEEHICMVLMWPRRPGLQLLEETYINESNVQALTQAAEDCWKAILNKDLQAFAQAYRASFEAQIRMFPAMISPEITEVIDTYKDQVMAWKMPGAGGGGYLAFVCEQPLPNSIRIKIRRKGL
ncbi:MAG: adenylyltransferase/cytidyltransferase family protein [Bacteroidales bacterium]|jgi:cytidyltransferase-like protein|nr:adenylyltransferase/cytidyltransferase family protein [Bacteroidales bacterium]HKL91930.1 adenylyltransferase/cytidyltransferase family protein [Bacteroidales bacterium]